jgi:adenylylsulfate kinase-like enzyme
VRSCLYSLTGYPGTGKYTIAKELVRRLEERGETARLVDNHTVGDPILGLIPISRETPVPPEIWERVRAVAGVGRGPHATNSPPPT